MPKITRLTLFKVPDVGDIEKAILAFSTLAKDAIKVSWVIHLSRRDVPSINVPSSQGTCSNCGKEYIVTFLPSDMLGFNVYLAPLFKISYYSFRLIAWLQRLLIEFVIQHQHILNRNTYSLCTSCPPSQYQCSTSAMYHPAVPDGVTFAFHFYSRHQLTLPTSTLLTNRTPQDGKPYILSASANMIYPDPRNQGYNLAAHADFSSKEDMDYYDNADLAHAIIKDVLKGKLDGPPLVIYEKWGDEDTGMSRLEELPN